jgi:hypothetical protein
MNTQLAARRVRGVTAALAITLAAPAPAGPVAETGLLTGLGFVLAEYQKDDCQSSAEARRGALAGAAPAVLGGALGALGAVLTGGSVVKDTATGIVAGQIVAAVAGKRLERQAGAATGQQREVAQAICAAYQRAAQQRQPIVQELVDTLGAACGLEAQDQEGDGAALLGKLRACATADPGLLAAIGPQAQALWEANHSACVGAAAAVRNINARYARRQADAGGSFIGTPVMTACQAGRDTQAQWEPIRVMP